MEYQEPLRSGKVSDAKPSTSEKKDFTERGKGGVTSTPTDDTEYPKEI